MNLKHNFSAKILKKLHLLNLKQIPFTGTVVTRDQSTNIVCCHVIDNQNYPLLCKSQNWVTSITRKVIRFRQPHKNYIHQPFKSSDKGFSFCARIAISSVVTAIDRPIELSSPQQPHKLVRLNVCLIAGSEWEWKRGRMKQITKRNRWRPTQKFIEISSNKFQDFML